MKSSKLIISNRSIKWQRNTIYRHNMLSIISMVINLRTTLVITLMQLSVFIFGQTLLKFKGEFPDPNKTQNGIATYEYFENPESHERIKEGMFVYDFKGVDDYAGFNQNINGNFKDGKKNGAWNFSATMNDFGTQNPYFTGTLYAKTSFIDGRPDGKWTYSYAYKKRNKVYSYGTLKWGDFSAESKTEISYSFKDGQLCGPVEIIDGIKGISIEGAFATNGMLDGKWTITNKVSGTTEVIEYKNSILFDSYKLNANGEIIQRISEKDKKRFDEISEIKKMTEEQRIDAGVHIDTVRTGYIQDWSFELASYTNVFYKDLLSFMSQTIGGETGFDGLKEIVITRERRTPLKDMYSYNYALTYFNSGNYYQAFISLNEIINDQYEFKTLIKKDKETVQSLLNTCKDNIRATIQRSSTNISYLKNIKDSVDKFGQTVLNSGIWKSDPFVIRNGGYYDGQTTTHNGNWYNRDKKDTWSQLRSYYPIWTQLITDKYLEMNEAIYKDEGGRNIVAYPFDENGNYKPNYRFEYDIRDSSSFHSKRLLSDYNKSVELFNVIIELKSIHNEVDTIIETFDERSIKKAFIKINDQYKNKLLNINDLDQILLLCRSEMMDYKSILRFLKNSNKEALKDLIKKTDDTSTLINQMKN